MKKRGFTLIELLAVIVILAIIVLIAAPVVVDIIGDSKKDGIINGASMYLKAINMSMADAQLGTGFLPEGTFKLDKDGNICFNDDCTDKLIVKTTGNIPTGGTITIKDSFVEEVNFDYSGTRVVINERGVPEFYENPCKLLKGEEKAKGSMYECEVKSGTKYNFYVLGTNNEGITSLILEKNINSDGTLSGSSGIVSNGSNVYNLVKWNSSSTSYTTGPITAMDFLKDATKEWSKISEIKINSFVDDKGDSYNMSEYDIRARLPYYSEVRSLDSYLTKNLSSSLNGYWTFSPCIDCGYEDAVWLVYYSGEFYDDSGNGSSYGIRPVIEVKL